MLTKTKAKFLIVPTLNELATMQSLKIRLAVLAPSRLKIFPVLATSVNILTVPPVVPVNKSPDAFTSLSSPESPPVN
jgi:hypothetical protein